MFVFQDRKLKLSASVWKKIGKPYKISTPCAHSDIFFHFFYRLSDWVEILWGFTKFFFKQMLKVSAFYLEKQKSFIPKKIVFWPFSISKQKKLCLLTQFSGWFWVLPNSAEDRIQGCVILTSKHPNKLIWRQDGSFVLKSGLFGNYLVIFI